MSFQSAKIQKILNMKKHFLNPKKNRFLQKSNLPDMIDIKLEELRSQTTVLYSRRKCGGDCRYKDTSVADELDERTVA